MASNLVQRYAIWSYRPYQNLWKIDYHLRSHIFDEVIRKPPILIAQILQSLSCKVCSTLLQKLVAVEASVLILDESAILNQCLVAML